MKLDHIELFVPSRREAADWYGKVLGFEIIADFVHWAEEGGPLMITNDTGETKIALFRGKPQGESEVRGFRRLAFRVDAVDFLRFLDTSGTWRSPPLGRAEIQDHGKALSVYFADPYGNLLEVTTYDDRAAREALGSR